MAFHTCEPLSPDPDNLYPSPFRRRSRFSNGEEGSPDELALEPRHGYDFVRGTLICGVLLMAAILFDVPALALLAVLAAPCITPALALPLAPFTGATRCVLRSLLWLAAVGAVMAACGALAGWLAPQLPAWLPAGRGLGDIHTWAGLAAVLWGAYSLTEALLRREGPHRSASAALGYGLYLPLAAAGAHLTSGSDGLWQRDLLLFVAYLGFAGLASLAACGRARMRPRSRPVTALAAVVCLAAAVMLVVPAGGPAPVSGSSGSRLAGGEVETTTAPAALPDETSQVPAFVTATPTLPPTATLTPPPTITVTPQPTPVWARVDAKEGDGAFVRQNPGRQNPAVASLLNGSLVEIIEGPVSAEGIEWFRVRTEAGVEGWIMASLLSR